MAEFERIYTEIEFEKIQKNDNEEKSKMFISDILANSIANFIIDNWEELPLNYTITAIPNNGKELHRIKLNIISDAEYNRLRDI